MSVMDRRAFLARGAVVAGSLAVAGPLEAFRARVATAAPIASSGYGPLVDMGDLWLPEGFQYRIISKRGDLMTDVNPATGLPFPMPSRFDGMAAFSDDPANGETILLRNHENRSRRLNFIAAEIRVEVPNPYDGALRPDGQQVTKGGVTRLVVRNRELVSCTAALGGTVFNCAGGKTPWGSWLSCEEEAADSGTGTAPIPHGYVFEVDAGATHSVDALPITAAGRFDHEAVVWHNQRLYLTEDKGLAMGGACFYRYTPTPHPVKAGDLAASTGPLDALVVDGYPNLNTSADWPVPLGEPLPVSWVTVPNPDPQVGADASPTAVRFQAQALGAARFQRTEGCWEGDDRIYFDCTTGGPASLGQIWELDTKTSDLRLVFQSDDPAGLFHPDNLTVAPTHDLFICEDTGGDPVPHIRALTPDGLVYDFARAGRGGQPVGTNLTEFCGACFTPVPSLRRKYLDALTLYVNQQGAPGTGGAPWVTYAIWGPWKRA